MTTLVKYTEKPTPRFNSAKISIIPTNKFYPYKINLSLKPHQYTNKELGKLPTSPV